jgi:hypothetical protein
LTTCTMLPSMLMLRKAQKLKAKSGSKLRSLANSHPRLLIINQSFKKQIRSLLSMEVLLVSRQVTLSTWLI